MAIFAGGIKPVTSIGGICFNNVDEKIMEQYAQDRKELAGRYTIVQANYLERMAGRGPIMIDLTHVPADKTQWMLHTHYTYALTDRLISLGVDYRHERIEWAPAVHTFLGGLKIDADGCTSLHGVFSAGETAGFGGVNGADRACTALLSCGVGGRRAGKSAALWALKTRGRVRKEIPSAAVRKEVEALRETRSRDSGMNPAEARKQVEALAWEKVNVVRDETSLTGALKRFAEIKNIPFAAKGQRSFIDCMEVQNLALAGEMVCRSALTRKESRGQHLRADYPYTDNDKWLKWILLKRKQDEMDVQKITVPHKKYKNQPPKGKWLHPSFETFESKRAAQKK